QKHTVGHARAIAWHLFQNFFDQAAYRQGSITMLKIPPSLPRCCLSIFANPLNTHWNLVPLCDVNELIERGSPRREMDSVLRELGLDALAQRRSSQSEQGSQALQ